MWLVGEHNARAQRLGVGELQNRLFAVVGEVALAPTVHDRVDPDPVLVDQLLRAEIVRQIGASLDAELFVNPSVNSTRSSVAPERA